MEPGRDAASSSCTEVFRDASCPRIAKDPTKVGVHCTPARLGASAVVAFLCVHVAARLLMLYPSALPVAGGSQGFPVWGLPPVSEGMIVHLEGGQGSLYNSGCSMDKTTSCSSLLCFHDCPPERCAWILTRYGPVLTGLAQQLWSSNCSYMDS